MIRLYIYIVVILQTNQRFRLLIGALVTADRGDHLSHPNMLLRSE